MPYAYIRKLWTKELGRFTLNPLQHMPGLNIGTVLGLMPYRWERLLRLS